MYFINKYIVWLMLWRVYGETSWRLAFQLMAFANVEKRNYAVHVH